MEFERERGSRYLMSMATVHRLSVITAYIDGPCVASEIRNIVIT